jgi:putative oxidoreductase
MLKKILCFPFRILDAFRAFDFLAPLAMRLYLVPILWFAGKHKFDDINKVADWFQNGLNLPNAELLAQIVTYTELAGAGCLLLGFAVRIITIPIMILMGMAAYLVHMAHGWYYIAPETSDAGVRLTGFMEWLQLHFPERLAYITEFGNPAIIQSGVEHAVTYFIMAMTLFFIGGGRYFSLDYWIAKKFRV